MTLYDPPTRTDLGDMAEYDALPDPQPCPHCATPLVACWPHPCCDTCRDQMTRMVTRHMAPGPWRDALDKAGAA